MTATYNSNNHVHEYQFLIFSCMSLYVTRLNDHSLALCFFPFIVQKREKSTRNMYIWNIHVFDQVQSVFTYSRVIRLLLKKWSFSMSTVYNFMLLYVHNANTDSFMYEITVRLTRCSPFLLIRVLATYSWKNWIFSYQTCIISSYCVCMLLIQIVYVISLQLYAF